MRPNFRFRGVLSSWHDVLELTGELNRVPGSRVHHNDRYEVIRLESGYQIWERGNALAGMMGPTCALAA